MAPVWPSQPLFSITLNEPLVGRYVGGKYTENNFLQNSMWPKQGPGEQLRGSSINTVSAVNKDNMFMRFLSSTVGDKSESVFISVLVFLLKYLRNLYGTVMDSVCESLLRKMSSQIMNNTSLRSHTLCFDGCRAHFRKATTKKMLSSDIWPADFGFDLMNGEQYLTHIWASFGNLSLTDRWREEEVWQTHRPYMCSLGRPSRKQAVFHASVFISNSFVQPFIALFLSKQYTCNRSDFKWDMMALDNTTWGL